MAQHDQVIDNGSGLTVRTDFNSAIAALFSNSSGPVEPSVTVAGQFWWDTANASNPVLRQRNLANTGWMSVFQGGQSAIDIAAGKRAGPPKDTFVWNDKLDLSGTDVMTLDDTGNLTIIGKAIVNGLLSSGDIDLAGHKLLNAKIAVARQSNLIVNPSMSVSQENGTNTVTTSNAYPADQWIMVNSGVVAGANQYSLVSPDRSNTVVGLSVTTAKPSLSAGDYALLIQFIEGLRMVDLQWGTSAAVPAVLRFNASAAMAGTYSISLTSGGSDQTFVATFTLAANTWKTVVIPIPATTTGTWAKDNTRAAILRFCHCCGVTNIGVAGWQSGVAYAGPGQVNAAATASQSLAITDVGLYPDPENTGLPPPFIAPIYSAALIDCLRYYFKDNAGQALPAVHNNFVVRVLNAYYPVAMRTNPTVAATIDQGTPSVAGKVNYSLISTSNAAVGTGCNLTSHTANARM